MTKSKSELPTVTNLYFLLSDIPKVPDVQKGSQRAPVLHPAPVGAGAARVLPRRHRSHADSSGTARERPPGASETTTHCRSQTILYKQDIYLQ